MSEKLFAYKRDNGRWGLRNHVLVLPLHSALASTARAIADASDGAVAISHDWSGEIDSDLKRILFTLTGYASNPNNYAVLFLTIGSAEEKSIIRNVVPTFNEKFSEATYSYAVTYASQVDGSESTSCTVNRTVWYQNARSYSERLALVGKYGLGGAALWTLGMEGQLINDVIREVATGMAPDPVVNTISTDGINQDSIYYGDLFTVKGLFTRKDLTPIAGLAVALEIKRANEDPWSTIAELTTASDGSISTPMTLGGTASLRLTTAEINGLAKSQSSEVKILVKSKLQVDRPISAPKASSFVIKAQLLPRLAGKSAFLQKNVNGKWQNVGVASISDTNGVFTFTTSESKRGVVTMRIQVEADLSSEPFAIVVR